MMTILFIIYFIDHHVSDVNTIKSQRNQDTLKICRVELCTELFYAIIPTLFPSMLCADLISLTFVTLLMFFYSCAVLRKCMNSVSSIPEHWHFGSTSWLAANQSDGH